MSDIKELIQEVLDSAYLMSLATVDESGPWVSDVIFITDQEWNLYWLSKTDARHSQAISKNPSVAASITVSNDQGEDNIGLQIEGIASKLEGDYLELSTKHLAKRKKPAPKSLGEIFTTAQSWYCLKPRKLELIYEPLFGFTKKSLEL